MGLRDHNEVSNRTLQDEMQSVDLPPIHIMYPVFGVSLLVKNTDLLSDSPARSCCCPSADVSHAYRDH